MNQTNEGQLKIWRSVPDRRITTGRVPAEQTMFGEPDAGQMFGTFAKIDMFRNSLNDVGATRSIENIILSLTLSDSAEAVIFIGFWYAR